LLKLAEANRLLPSFVVTSPQRMGALFRAQMSRQIADDAALALDSADPALSARSRLSEGQTIYGGLLALSTLGLGLVWPEASAITIAIVLWILFAATVGLRFAALAVNPTSPRCRPLEDQEFPVYSIIAPLLREASILDRLIQSLDAIDYPRSRLDIKIVLEEDDFETLVAVAANSSSSMMPRTRRLPISFAERPRASSRTAASIVFRQGSSSTTSRVPG